jgi:hypothetical protein
MADKKKKKSKMKVIVSKQNRNKQQVQQVTVNVAVGRRSSNKQPRQQAQPPPKAPNLNYELFRTINSYVTTQQKKADETPKDTSPALFQNTPERNPQPSASSFVKNVIDKSNLFNKSNIPLTNTKPPPSAFDKVLSTSKPPPPPTPVEEDVKPVVEEEEFIMTPKIKPRPTTPAPPPPNNIRFTAKGLPRRKSSEEKRAYDDYMRDVIGNKAESERTKEEAKAYKEYASIYGDYANDNYTPAPPSRPPVQRRPRKIQPDNEDKTEEDEDEMFFSPLQRKPT